MHTIAHVIHSPYAWLLLIPIYLVVFLSLAQMSRVAAPEDKETMPCPDPRKPRSKS